MVVSSNLLAMNAQRQFNINTKSKQKSTEKLSSGYRINRSADDAAGLAISEKMRRQIRGLTQGVKNTQDGISLCQVADGALDEVDEMLHRITELAVKAANGTNTEEERAAIQNEVSQILCEVDRISESTSFNDRKIFFQEPPTIVSDLSVSQVRSILSQENFPTAGTSITKNDKVLLSQKGANEIFSYMSCYYSVYTLTETLDPNSVFAYDGVGGTNTKKTAVCMGKVANAWKMIAMDRLPEQISKIDADYQLMQDGINGYLTQQNVWRGLWHGETDRLIDTATRGADAYNHATYSYNGYITQEWTKLNSDVNILTGAQKVIGHAAMLAAERQWDVLDHPDIVDFPEARDGGKEYFEYAESSLLNLIKTTIEHENSADAKLNSLGNSLHNADDICTLYQYLMGDTYLDLHEVKDWWIQSGAEADDGINLEIDAMNTKLLGIKNLNVSTQSGARDAIDAVKGALEKVSSNRSKIGAQQNRLEHTIANENNIIENTTAAESKIRDTDMAKEMEQLSLKNILEQAGISMMAQANQSNQSVLQLLQ